MENPRVSCVVVTYNRKKLLLECLEAIYAQTFRVSSVILINNASTDQTEDALREAGYFAKDNFDYHLMPKNLGGAGGFYEGIKISRDKGSFDWCWIMDDDTIPSHDALENLLKAAASLTNNTSFLASCVYGSNGEPMNVPGIDSRPTSNGYPDWYRNLTYGIVKIECATFVSLLLNSKAIMRCGLPCRDYFIWGDDTEYTLRFTKYYGSAYLVGRSEVCHKRIGARGISILNETDPQRLSNFFYFYRNSMINSFIYVGGKRAWIAFLKSIVGSLRFLCKPLGFRRFMIVLRGTLSGWFNWRKFDSVIRSQIKDC